MIKKTESELRAEHNAYDRGYFMGLQVGVFGTILIAVAALWAVMS